MSSNTEGVREGVPGQTTGDGRRPYSGPLLVSFGSIPGRTFATGSNGSLDGPAGPNMQTSI